MILASEARDQQGRTCYEAAAQMIGTSEYQRATPGPGGGKEFMFQKLDHQYRQIADEMLKAEFPTLRDAVQMKQLLRLERRSGEPIPTNLIPPSLLQSIGR